MTTVYVTKYALSAGIQECTVNERRSSPARVYVDWLSSIDGVTSLRDGEWWETREDAVTRANQMKREKIASLKKKIAKLEKKTFV